VSGTPADKVDEARLCERLQRIARHGATRAGAESATPADLAAGARVLAEVLAELAR
jgi:hypothetical protein